MSWQEAKEALAGMWGQPIDQITDEDVLAFKNGSGLPLGPKKNEGINKKTYDEQNPGIHQGSINFDPRKRNLPPPDDPESGLYGQIMAKSEK